MGSNYKTDSFTSASTIELFMFPHNIRLFQVVVPAVPQSIWILDFGCFNSVSVGVMLLEDAARTDPLQRAFIVYFTFIMCL